MQDKSTVGMPSGFEKLSGYVYFAAVLIGVFIFGSGMGMLIVAFGFLVCDTGASGSLAGLGVIYCSIIGLPLLFLGFIIFVCLIPLALQRLSWRWQRVVLPALLILSLPLGVASSKVASLMHEVDRERQTAFDEAMARDKRILDEYKKDRYARLLVVCRIRKNFSGQELKDRQTQMKEFAADQIIKPLGAGIKKYEIKNWGGSDIYFVADVTQESYEVLKQNMHVWKIELYRLFKRMCANSKSAAQP